MAGRNCIAALALALAAAAPADARTTAIGAGTRPAMDAGARTMAYETAGGVVVRELAGGAETAIPGAAEPAVAGGRVAYVLGGDVHLRSPDGATLRLTSGNAPSSEPHLTPDGRFVVFSSQATNLIARDVNGVQDVFLTDVATGATSLVSQVADLPGTAASSAPAISPDGRFVTFSSASPNLVARDGRGLPDVFLVDRANGSVERVTADSLGFEQDGALPVMRSGVSAGGRFVAFESTAANLIGADRTRDPDVFVRDRTLNRNALASAGVAEAAAAPAISPSGRFVAFSAGGRVLLRDLKLAVTTDVGPGEGRPAVAAGGNTVAFAGGGQVLLQDTTPPPARLTRRGRRYSIASGDRAATTRLCSIDRRPYRPCQRRGLLPRGRHTLRVLVGGPGMRFKAL